MYYLRKILLLGAAVLMVVMFSSCEDLAVQNQNDPDRERALSSPDDIETLIQGTYRTFYYAGDSYEPSFAFSVAADEISSSWGNFGMQDFGSEPRIPYNNDPSYTYSAVATIPFSNAYSAISTALEGVALINEGTAIGDEARTQRAKAFGQFVVGASHAFVAVAHDQGFVVDKVPEVGSFNTSNPPFEIQPYDAVFQAGLDFMQQAIETAQNGPDFSIPSGWIGSSEYTKAEFIAIIKTYRAHYRAGIPRTPEERRNVDWQAVINDINEGYTEMNGGQTFSIVDTPQENWFSGLRYYSKAPGWTRVDIRTLGPAHKGDEYENWLNSSLGGRTPFLINTDDRRITGADGPKTDGKYMTFTGTAPFPEARGIYHYSDYTYSRNNATYLGYQTGNSKWMFTAPTMRLLKAEALLHLNATANKAEVVSIINESRVITGELDPAQLSDPTGSMSDPQSALNDASIWSKLKHEKRMESMATACGIAFFDKRGWGDLVEGTPEDLPIPGDELLKLEQPIYTTDVVDSAN